STRASALGDRAAISRAQNRAGARPLRRPLVPGLASSRGTHGGGLRVFSEGADATRRRSRSHVARCARERHRDFSGALVRPETVLSETDSRTTADSASDLTK